MPTLREGWKRKHDDPRISHDIEKPFREALGHAIRNELEEMREALLRLTDEQIASCLNLCAFVAGYVAIDVCGRQWPNEDKPALMEKPRQNPTSRGRSASRQKIPTLT